MFRVLGFLHSSSGLWLFAGNLTEMALLFFFCKPLFCHSGLHEIYREDLHPALLGGYMILTFTGFSYWTIFEMGLPL
ncbi:DUF2626 family protein [Paenibacillus rhizoplanae]